MFAKLYNFFTRKKRHSPKGEVEMKSFSKKRVYKSVSPKSISPRIGSVGSIGSVKSVGSVGSVKIVKSVGSNTKKMYRSRVKNSPCRGHPKPKCLNKSKCIFTKGELRKYCRKKHNSRR